ncbi:hypothetical protein G7Y89_g3290 [Cudoniella acicularis]|uniref:Uncharacterized protein n=1 Tax=Cudoniella acicularis TaxID=354080 RepID=A0A8H4W643_9HELO|nr:hypothetical protein G7Y89_g3290 [Cudoniella acicularis]
MKIPLSSVALAFSWASAVQATVCPSNLLIDDYANYNTRHLNSLGQYSSDDNYTIGITANPLNKTISFGTNSESYFIPLSTTRQLQRINTLGLHSQSRGLLIQNSPSSYRPTRSAEKIYKQHACHLYEEFMDLHLPLLSFRILEVATPRNHSERPNLVLNVVGSGKVGRVGVCRVTEGAVTEGRVTEDSFVEVTEGRVTEGRVTEGSLGVGTEGSVAEETVGKGSEGTVTDGTVTEGRSKCVVTEVTCGVDSDGIGTDGMEIEGRVADDGLGAVADGTVTEGRVGRATEGMETEGKVGNATDGTDTDGSLIETSAVGDVVAIKPAKACCPKAATMRESEVNIFIIVSGYR